MSATAESTAATAPRDRPTRRFPERRLVAAPLATERDQRGKLLAAPSRAELRRARRSARWSVGSDVHEPTPRPSEATGRGHVRASPGSPTGGSCPPLGQSLSHCGPAAVVRSIAASARRPGPRWAATEHPVAASAGERVHTPWWRRGPPTPSPQHGERSVPRTPPRGVSRATPGRGGGQAPRHRTRGCPAPRPLWIPRFRTLYLDRGRLLWLPALQRHRGGCVGLRADRAVARGGAATDSGDALTGGRLGTPNPRS